MPIDGRCHRKTDHFRLPFAGRHHCQKGTSVFTLPSCYLFQCWRFTLLQALIYSNGRTSHKIQHLHSIFVSTYAIVFLGTPHLGSGVANLFKYVERLVHTIAPSLLVDTTPQLLNALKEGSEILQEITDGFVPLMQTFRIYFFWEQVKTKLGVTYDYVRTALSLSITCSPKSIRR